MTQLVKSDLENINSLIEGYDTQIPLAVYGVAKTGKTLFGIQESFWLMKQTGKNALFFSTEIGIDRYVEKWEPVFREKFKVPDTLKFIIKECPPQDGHLVLILKEFGKHLKMEMSEHGKVDISFLKRDDESPIEKLITKENIGILVIDSLTKPFKSEEFAGVLKNLPSRATGVTIWLNAIHTLTLKHKLLTFVTHHASLDPTKPYALAYMTGGSDINYDFKIQIYMEQSKSLQYSNMRWVHLVRFLNVKEWAKKTRLWVDNGGYKDVDEAFVQAEMKKRAEEKKEKEKLYKESKQKKDVKKLEDSGKHDVSVKDEESDKT